MKSIDGNAVVYCEGAFNTTNGKTAHGLVRFTERYNILSVIDSRFKGKDSGRVLDGKENYIPLVGSLEEAIELADINEQTIKNFVVGLAPDGGRLPKDAFHAIKEALGHKLDIVSGLHDFLSDKMELWSVAKAHSCKITDVRKPPARDDLHFFSGKIEEVTSRKIAILGTDSAVGKRTTAWLIVHELRKQGFKTEMIGTGQTAWLQGAKYGIILDSLVNDFVSGEIEHAVHEAWKNERPEVIILEGQGSLMNPAYPGGFELLAAGRPDFVILQHAPRRVEYDGFPGYHIQSLSHQIKAIEIISGIKVKAITLNHEKIDKAEIEVECQKITNETGLPAFDVLENGAADLIEVLKSRL